MAATTRTAAQQLKQLHPRWHHQRRVHNGGASAAQSAGVGRDSLPTKCGAAPISKCDLMLKCRGEYVHVASSKLLKATNSKRFWEEVQQAMAERNLMKEQLSNIVSEELGLLNLPDDEPEAWRICWALIDNASKLPDIKKGNFTAALKLAHRNRLDGVLSQCQDMITCDLLAGGFWTGRVLMSTFSQKSCINLITTTLQEPQDLDDCLQFIGLLWDVGLITAYKTTISYVLARHGRKILPYLKQRMELKGSLADCPQVSKDLTVWLLHVAEKVQDPIPLP